MAHFHQRGDTWTGYWYFVDSSTGKRRQGSKGGFKSRTAALKHAQAIEAAAQQGTWRPEAKLTVWQLIRDHYLPARTAEGLRPATLEQYRQAAKWLDGIGGLEVRALTPAKVQELAEALRSSGSRLGRGGLSPRSVQLTATVLKAATAWAAATGLMLRDPLAGYKRPRAGASDVSQAWSMEEARTFLSSVADNRMSAAWSLLLTRGLRRGEQAGLRWDAVDLEGGAIHIRSTRIVVGGRAVDSEPKTRAGRRRVPLDDSLVTALRAHRRHQLEERMAAGAAYEDTGYTFTDELGRPYRPEWWDDQFDQLVARAGLRRIRLHDARHTAVTLMAFAGVPAYVCAEIVGHSSARMVEEVYRHVLPGQTDQAGEAISKVLLG